MFMVAVVVVVVVVMFHFACEVVFIELLGWYASLSFFLSFVRLYLVFIVESVASCCKMYYRRLLCGNEMLWSCNEMLKVD